MFSVSTTVFSGFLGSGKTTIISHLIEVEQLQGQQIIYIKNEIGDENIDAQLMKGKNIASKELLNGCICCTLVGPFIQAIDELIDQYHPDRIIIEASGVADPAAIALMIDSHPKLNRDGVISIIDVTNFEGYQDLSQTAKNQTKFTDLIVFNKIELADLHTKQVVVGYVRELNDYSPIVEAPGGILDPSVAFGLTHAQLQQLDQILDQACYSPDSSHHNSTTSHHLEDDGLESFSINLPKMSQDALDQFLQNLPGAVYRAKGICQAGPDLILINKVGNRIDLTPISSAVITNSKSVLVLIGFRIKQHRTKITDQLTKLPKES